VEAFDGDLDAYAAWLRSRPSAESTRPAAEAPAAAKPEPAQAVAPRAKPAPKVNPVKLQQAEARVARIEAKLAECEARMSDPATYADAGAIADLGRQQMQLRGELEEAEAQLLGLYDAA
jgi:ATP-binding cassette subfamily F protein 3